MAPALDQSRARRATKVCETMQGLNVALVAIGGLTLVLSPIAGPMRNRVYVLSEPMAAVLLGVAIGPRGAGLLELANWSDSVTILEQFAHHVRGVTVIAAALRFPPRFRFSPRYVRDHARSSAMVLVPGGVWLGGALADALLDASRSISRSGETDTPA